MNRFVRGGAGVMAAALVMGGTGACDYATRKEEATLLVDAAKRAEQAGTATGTMAISLDIEKTSPEFQAFAQAVRLPPIAVQFDFAERAASTAGVAVVPQGIFRGPVVYLRRPAAPGAADSQFGFRAWSKLDFSEVGKKDANELTQPNPVNPVNPTYLVRLLAGTLSGSVRQLGTETIDGKTTRHFRMNVDRAKAFSRLNDDDRQAVDRAFASNNISGEVYKSAETWIDADGLPRRFVLRVRQKLDQDNVFGITYRIELSKFGGPLTIRAPQGDNTAEVSSWNALLNSAGGR